MPTTITTSTAATATAYSNQRKIDRCSNGVLWAHFYNDGTAGAGGSAYLTDARFAYSLDNGATWTQAESIASSNTATENFVYNSSFFIDVDDYAHLVYKSRADGYIYYRRGTPNAARTAWTWSAATTVTTTTTSDYPDIVAHREGTGWVAQGVFSRSTNDTFKASWFRIPIDSGGTIGAVASNNLVTTAYGNDNHSYPSIDFNHTGDGKTVAGGTPHLYAAWSAGVAGGIGIRFKKATYSSGAWTWGTERPIDTARYWTAQAGQCMFDGTRVIIAAGYAVDASAIPDIMLYERDAADTTTTPYLLVDNPVAAEKLINPHSTYDGDGNVYFFGRNDDETAGTHDLVYRKWTRLGASLGPEVVIDSGVGANVWPVPKRGYSNNRIEFIYTDGTASPYNVVFDSILLNATPNVPTALTTTSDVLDTTPVFSADISDPDTSQQIKGRFQIYQSDGTTLVGTIDSALRTGAGTVTAEYASALPVGNYKVQAATVDDIGAISAYTAQVSFQVKQAVEEDINFLWKTDALIVEDISYRWNVLVSNQKDITFTWNTTVQVEEDIALRWGLKTPWTVVDSDLEAPVLWEKVSS